MTRRFQSASIFTLLALFLGAAVQAESFVRLDGDDPENPRALQVAIAHYQPATGQPLGLKVDVIGAVHVGDAAYYAELNQRFRDYDAVLYELVAPENTRVSPDREPSGFVGRMQTLMQSGLDLAYQLEEVDYHQENLVHADMSPDEFAESMKKRGESFLGWILKSMLQSMQMGAGAVSNADVIAAFLATDRAYAMKVLMAQQFAFMEQTLVAFEGDQGSTLIAERNKKALSVLRQQIDAGERKIAIFYGAGHMPDFDQRLKDEFNMIHTRSTWLDAWNLEE